MAGFRDRHADWGRDLALYLGRKACGKGLSELGKRVDYAAVSMALKRFERRAGKEKALAKQVRKALKLLKVQT